MDNKKYYYQKEKVEAELKTFYEERDKEREVVKKRESYFEDIERRAKKMAIEIISQNSIYANEKETQAGLKKGHKSVYSLSTVDLLKEAEKSRNEYNAKRNELMKELMRKNSQLKLNINNLKEHASIDLNKQRADKQTIDELRGKVESLLKGRVKETYIVETDYSKKAKKHLQEKVRETADITQKRKTEELLESIEIEEIKESDIGDRELINALTNKLKNCDSEVWERAKNLFATIGMTGATLKPDIKKIHEKRLKKQAEEKNVKIDLKHQIDNLDNAFEKLEKLGVLSKDKVVYWDTHVTSYVLTGIGNKVYKNLIGKNPEPSEASKILSCHSNLRHGYGIVKLAELMREFPNRFSEISEYNKGGKGKILHVKVRTDDGKLEPHIIEPDIAFTEKKGNEYFERYIEYELGSQTPEEYFVKINKYVSRGENNIFFVFPNKTTKEAFKRHIKFFYSKKAEKGIDYPDLKFFLYTVEEFRDMCNENTDWIPYDSTLDSRYSKTPEEVKAQSKQTDEDIKTTKID